MVHDYNIDLKKSDTLFECQIMDFQACLQKGYSEGITKVFESWPCQLF